MQALESRFFSKNPRPNQNRTVLRRKGAFHIFVTSRSLTHTVRYVIILRFVEISLRLASGLDVSTSSL
jgi:hypothetical protein